jgi:hypothetical protein
MLHLKAQTKTNLYHAILFLLQNFAENKKKAYIGHFLEKATLSAENKVDDSV